MANGDLYIFDVGALQDGGVDLPQLGIDPATFDGRLLVVSPTGSKQYVDYLRRLGIAADGCSFGGLSMGSIPRPDAQYDCTTDNGMVYCLSVLYDGDMPVDFLSTVFSDLLRVTKPGKRCVVWPYPSRFLSASETFLSDYGVEIAREPVPEEREYTAFATVLAKTVETSVAKHICTGDFTHRAVFLRPK